MICRRLDGLSKYLDLYSSNYESIMSLSNFDVGIYENHLKSFCDDYIVYRDAFKKKEERQSFKNKLVAEFTPPIQAFFAETKSLKSYVLAPDANRPLNH